MKKGAKEGNIRNGVRITYEKRGGSTVLRKHGDKELAATKA